MKIGFIVPAIGVACGLHDTYIRSVCVCVCVCVCVRVREYEHVCHQHNAKFLNSKNLLLPNIHLYLLELSAVFGCRDMHEYVILCVCKRKGCVVVMLIEFHVWGKQLAHPISSHPLIHLLTSHIIMYYTLFVFS